MWFLLGFVGWMMTFYGVYQIGNLNIRGFYWMLAAEVLIITDALAFGHFSLIFASVIFACINTRNVIKWRRNAKTSNIEAEFFAEHPEYVMQVFRSDGDVSVDISHDTHEKADVYLTGPANTETKLRQQAVQTVLDNLG